MPIHPIISLSASLMLAAILLAAASHKLRAPHRFARQIGGYDLLPAGASAMAARAARRAASASPRRRSPRARSMKARCDW